MKDLCSFDAPHLLGGGYDGEVEEVETLFQLFISYTNSGGKESFASIVEHLLYTEAAPETEDGSVDRGEPGGWLDWYRGGRHRGAKGRPFDGEWNEVEIECDYYAFTQEGLVLEKIDSNQSYCSYYDKSSRVGLVLMPQGPDVQYGNMVFYEPTTEWGKVCLDRFKECLDYVLDSRSEQLKTALASDDDRKKKGRQRCFEEAQKGLLTNTAIGIKVAAELGEEIPYSEGTVRNWIVEYQVENCPTVPLPKRRPGRPPNKKDA